MDTTHDPRRDQLTGWLRSLPGALGLAPDTLRPVSGDASFRRYFRVDAAGRTLIVMDAPPGREDCRPFVHVAELLTRTGLNVPRIVASDLEQGLLLLTDLGPDTYYQRVVAGLADDVLQRLYRDALAALVRMQTAPVQGLPAYDAARLAAELELFPQWYAERHCGVTLAPAQAAALQKVFSVLVAHNAAQPRVLVHRDYHSPNLIVSDDPDRYGPNPGVLDFQDALAGPISYDIASLVMDARTTWEEPQQLDWAIRYWDMARRQGLPVPADFAEFHRDYEWMGLQRNLRILGVFARLHHRDGKSGYLDHIPRVSAYVRQVARRYDVFAPLVRLLDTLENRQATVGFTF